MVSSNLRPALGTILASIALAAVTAPPASFTQPRPPVPAEDALEDLVAEIEETESLWGANSPDLVEPLTALSLLYEERGNYELALALIDKATQVIEINHGLHTLEEAQLMRQSIRIERARGNAEAAWNEETELLRLIRRRRHQADTRTVPILREIADQRRAILARYQAGEFPPEIVLGCYYSEWAFDDHGAARRTGCRSGSRDTVIRALRIEAAGYDSEAEGFAGRVAYWAETPCVKPEPSVMAAERHSKQRTKEEMQAYFRAVSDYSGCTQVKYQRAASANAPAEELSHLASQRDAAAVELTTQAAIYNERFGR